MGSGCNILIVEDESNWQRVLSTLLKAEGHKTEVASGFSEAFDKILHSGTWFVPFEVDVCVVDLNLAGPAVAENLDGLGMVYVCKEHGIPAIVVSGYLKRQMKDQLLDQLEVTACFEKNSFPRHEFLATVKTACVPQDRALRPEIRGMDELEFRAKLQNLVDMLIKNYKEAYANINDRHRQRVAVIDQATTDQESWLRKSERIWLKELGMLDRAFRGFREKINQIKTSAEIDKLQPELIAESLTWAIGLTE